MPGGTVGKGKEIHVQEGREGKSVSNNKKVSKHQEIEDKKEKKKKTARGTRLKV